MEKSEKSLNKAIAKMADLANETAREHLKDFVKEMGSSKEIVKLKLYRVVDEIVDSFFDNLTGASSKYLQAIQPGTIDFDRKVKARVEARARAKGIARGKERGSDGPGEPVDPRSARTILDAIVRLFQILGNSPQTINGIVAGVEVNKLYSWGKKEEKVKYDTVHITLSRNRDLFEQVKDTKPFHYKLKEMYFSGRQVNSQ